MHNKQETRQQPAISIALCTYNGEKYLEEQLESIKNQTLLPKELVVIDDNSQDRTLKILTAFKTKAPFEVIIISNEENQGLTENPWENFFRAVAQCKYDLVSFCDQDDVWHPSKLEALAKPLAENNDVFLSFCNATVTDEALNPTRILYDVQKSKIFSIYNFELLSFLPLGFTQLFRKSLLSSSWEIRPRGIHFDRPMAHDEFVAFLALCHGKIAYCSQPLALYRRHRNAHSISSPSPSEEKTEIASYRQEGKLEKYREVCKGRYIEKSKIYLNWYQYAKNHFSDPNSQESADFLQQIYHVYQLKTEIYSEGSRLRKIKTLIQLLGTQYYLYFRSDMRLLSPFKDILFALV